MLIDMLIHQPQMLGTVLRHTPGWVWGLLAGLLALGLSQVRDRNASLARVTFLPVAMTALALWGIVAGFGNSPMFGYVVLVWLLAAALMVGAISPTAAPRGTAYDAASRTYRMRGSWIPLLLILGTFLTKYVVGVDLAMKPSLALDGQYTLVVGTLYGLFSGIFTGRAARLWLLARRAGPVAAEPRRGFWLQRDPW